MASATGTESDRGDRDDRGQGIAIVGMAGRFPGAADVEGFWDNLLHGIESITRFSAAELRAAGVEPELAADPAYVPARGIVEGGELFDAAFFGTGAREAEVLDPQHRLLLECAWEALERAGHDPRRFSGPIGVYAGAGINTYLLSNLQHNPEVVAAAGEYQAMLGSGGDFLATRISYHLGLRGPSLTVQTACSTSLVAVHLAVQSLLGGECDMALAGGVRLSVPRQAGHLFQPGGIFSPDGHCRPFDAAAAGIVEGEGAGLVVLRRLADALADGDHVHAVILGSAINNDGSFKMGYTAPSIEGQAEVVAMAQALAGIDPATIAFVEAHGTGTQLGDPIEVAALVRAFAAGGGGPRRIACALGSVKGNIGHLDAAAGVASLIKAALAVEHGVIPPSLHFERPNPEIDLAAGPFYVPRQPTPWPATAAGEPRRAGVSSFGIGGTNAHLVLAQAPAVEAEAAPATAERPHQLVILSARTEAALEAATANLADHLRRRPEADLAEVAFSLQLGRAAFDRRRIAVCDSAADAAGVLAALDPKRVLTRTREAGERAVVFLFPGQGTQHPGMGAELYRCEPTFRAQVDLGAEILRPLLGLDLRSVLYPAAGAGDAAAAERLEQTALAQPALFVVEHALARLWMEWGVRPQAMLGHSVGEYVAACLAGVWPFEDALRLVSERARLMQELPGGSMLAVPLPEAEVLPLLGGLSLAAVNGPAMCVVSGAAGEVEDLASRLLARGVQVRRLHTSHAFHSPAMEPILPRFAAALAGLSARPPRLPFLSNLTGTWIRPEEAVDPAYWASQLRQTVRFAAGLEELFARPAAALLEVGPGRALTALARRHPRRPGTQAALPSLPAPGDAGATDHGTALRSLGQLWLGGLEIDWAGFQRGRRNRRVALPTYPFERRRYWVEPLPGAGRARRRRAGAAEIADWFWVPAWRREPLAAAAAPAAEPADAAGDSWLVIGDAAGFGGRLAARLREHGRDAAVASAGGRFEQTAAGDFVLRPGEEGDYGALLDGLAAGGRAPARIVHAWCAGPAVDVARELELGFFGLVRLARALAARRPSAAPPPLHLGIVTTGMQRVAAEAELLPIRATLLGPAATIPQELPGITCQAIDVILPAAGSAWERRLLDALIAELAAAGDDPIVAYRGTDRWRRDFAPWQPPAPAAALPPPGATWLITGGLGGVGLEIATLLARQAARPKLILTSRQPFPEKAAWPALAQGEGRASLVARRLLDLEAAGAEVWVAQADVADAESLRRALVLARRRCGRIQGAVHAAGIAGGGLLQWRSLEQMTSVLAPKVRGTLLLAELLTEDEPDLLVLCSSLNALFGGPGQADYAAANAFLDAFAQSQCGKLPVLSIDWDTWRGIGMAATPEAPPIAGLQPFVHPLLKERGVRGDGTEVFVGRLRPGDSWVVDDHRLGGMPVMPGTAYLEMAGAAFREMAAATGAIEMRDVVFVSPMGLGDGETREFQALLRSNGDGFHFTVQSREGDGWAQHIVGTVGAALGAAPAAIDLAALAGGGWQEVTLGESYREELRVAGLGPRWEVLKKVYHRQGEAVGLLELAPELAADVDELALHPALLDVATGFAEAFLHSAAGGGYYLPLSYKRIQVLGALPSRIYSHARLREPDHASAETLAFDVTILDSSGMPRLAVEEFVIKRVDVAAALRRRARLGAAGIAPGAENAERREAAGGGDGMAPEQAVEALRRILAAAPLPQIAVSVRPLPELLAWGRALTAGRLAERAGGGAAGGHPRPDLDVPYVAPRDELEERLAAVWGEVLGLDRVGALDDFFELGGHSLLGTQLLSRVHEAFGVEVPLAKLFAAATVADFAAAVKERLAGPGPAARDEIPRLQRGGDLPLSFAQERIWFLDRLDPGNAFYNVSQAVRLQGRLDVAMLARAFGEIVRRHEVLHTAFVEVDGQPVQRVLPALPLPLPLADLSALPESRREAVAEQLAVAVTRRSFDLARPPLLAVQLARLAPERHVLVLTLHHIVADGWSIQVILANLAALYGAFLAGRRSPLPELPLQYADFAAWQRAALGRLDLEEQLAYWRRQLAPPLPRLELPLDRPRPASPTYRGRADLMVLPADQVAALKALCHREGATPFMGLLAVFSLLLGRWSGQRDLLIGSPIAGRDRREVEELIGIFLNTLVLRCDLSGPPTFRELLGRVRETAIQAYARQGVPVEKLLEDLRPERDPSRAGLFQVLFNMQDFPRVERQLPGLALTSLPLREVASKFDLTAYAAEVEGEIVFELVSNAHLFEPVTAQALLDQLRHLLTLAVASPDERIDRFSLVTAASAALLPDPRLPLPAAGASWPGPAHGRLALHAARSPARPAVVDAAGAWTYAELAARSGRLAARLAAAGLGRGDLVAIWGWRGATLAQAVLGVMQAGAAFLILDPVYPERRLVAAARRAAPRAWIVLRDAGPLPDGLAALAAAGALLLALDAHGGEGGGGGLDLPLAGRGGIAGDGGAGRAAGEAAPEPLAGPPAAAVGPDDAAYVAFTSGSTSEPKAVLGTHGPLSHFCDWQARTFALREQDAFCLLSGLSHDPLLRDLLTPLWVGATLHVPAPAEMASPSRLEAWLARERVSVAHLTPAVARAIAAGAAGATLPDLRRVFFGGDALTGADLARMRALAPNAELVNFYGTTETPQAMSWSVPAPGLPAAQRAGVGRGIDGVQLLVLSDGGGLAGARELGEIGVRTPHLSLGYLGDEALTAERFVTNPATGDPRDRIYLTGDLGRYRPDGDVDLAGRRDDQIKLHDLRIEPREIEAALIEHPRVSAAAVRLAGGADGRPRLAAWLVAHGEPRPPASELAAYLRTHLPEPMVPQAFAWLERLPLTPNGKLDAAALPSIAAERPEAEATATGPQVADLLAGIWSDLQPASRAGDTDRWFEAGSAARGEAAPGGAGRRDLETPLVPPPPRPPDGRLALSFAQERFWFLDRFELGGSAFNLPLAVRLAGPLEAGRLRSALDAVVARHEILRTTFDRDVGLPFQRVTPAVRGSFALPLIDLAGLAEAAGRGALARLAAAHRRRLFDLSRGPLLSAWLVRLGPRVHTLLLNVHAIAADDWSLGILAREIAAAYEGSEELPELPLQYADFALWQRRRVAGAGMAAHLAYWRERLAGPPAPLELPLDRQRPPVQVFDGDTRGGALAPALAAALAALGRRQGASLFMVLLAGFQILLQRLSGQWDLVLGTPVAGRTRPETEGLIGCFLNPLVLRTDLAGAPSFGELLERVRLACLGAYDHQDLPFESLLEELVPDRDLSRTPLFQVFFDMLDLPLAAPRLPGIELEVEADRRPPAKFDLTLYLREAAGGIALRAVYNAALFEPARIEEMLRQLELLLAQAAAAPERSIDGLSLVSDAVRRALPDPALPLSPEWRGAVHETFARLAAEHPQRTALVQGAETWSYGALEAAANRLSHYLLAAGLRPGERVAIYAHRSAPLAAAVLAALKAGGCFLLLDPAHPDARQVALIEDAAPRCWLQLAAAGPPPERLAERVLGLSRLTLPELGRWQEWAPLARLPATPPAVTVGADDPACLTFTSGSTGRPKGVLGRHGSLSHFIACQRQVFGMSAADRFSLLSGLAHDPLQRDLFTPLQLGAAVCVPDPDRILEPGWLAAWMAERQVTVAHLTPAMGQVLATGRAGEVPSLRLALLVGDVLTRRDVAGLRRIAPAVTCVNLYGATETQRAVGFYVSPPAAPAPPAEADAAAAESSGARQVLPLGRGMEDVQLLVLAGLGAEAGARLAGIGELGEICVRSPHLALGYLGDPGLTAERFLVNPFTGLPGDRVYRTGDLGRYLPAGDVAFAGRADSQVKVRGFRIELGEIEATLALHPALRDAAVVLREDGGEPYLAAYLVAKRAGGLNVEEVRAFLRQRLPGFMLPQTWTVLAALPLTPNRKLDRRALPLPRREAAAAAGPRGPLEEMLASLWSELLGVEQVGPEDDFFALGGHSLLATRLLARIAAAFGVEIPLRTVFQTPTFAATARAIAEQLRAGLGRAAPPLARRDAGEAACLSFGQQRLWFLDRLRPGDVAYNLPAAIRINGDFEVALAAACLSAVVRRHEALRTRFPEEDGSPRAVIAEPAPVPLPEVDLGALPMARAGAVADQLAQDQLRLPFDLASGPLLRACVVSLRYEFLLVFCVHHIAADGWSLALLRRELAVLYAMAAAGRPSSLPALPLQYADFASWQRGWLSGEVLDAQLDYWRGQLADAPAALELPADRPRQALPSARGGRQRRRLAPAATGRLARLAQGETATLFMVLVAAWQALLARWSGQPDVLVGTPVANRPRRELEGLIGFFANTLVLRARVDAADSFRGLLAQVRETALGAYTHQDLPFERLVDALAPERSLGRTPVFQVLVTLQPAADGQTVSLRDLTLTEVEVETGATQFDLSLQLVAGEGELSLALTYAADLFDGATAGRLLDRLEALLAAVAAAPERRLSEQPWLPAAELHQLLHEWNDRARHYGADRSLPGLLRERAARGPAAVALEWEDEEVSYGELASRASRLAAELRRLGVGGGSRVGVCMERSVEMIVALQGVLEAGGCYVPLDPSYPPARLQWMAADAGVEALLTQPRLAAGPAAPGVPAMELAAGWGTGGSAAPLTAVPEPATVPAATAAGEPAGEELAYVIYTSGSTGRPKGVMVSQRGIVNRLRWMQEAFGLGPSDRVLQKTPFSFDVSVWELFWPLLTGARMVISRPGGHQDGRYLVELMARSAVTVVHFVPSMLASFLAQPDVERLRALRLVVLSGEALSPELAAALLRRLPWAAVWNLYGPTEAAVDVTAWRCEPEWGLRPVPIGRPIANTRIVVMERWADGLGMAGVGVPGELAIGGVQLARGYLGRPDLTAERFVPDPFGGESGARLYRTGDLARTLAAGTVEYLGRLDHQVKVRGFRIELGEIEAALRGHPAVAEAVVTAPAAATGEGRLVAYLVARPGAAAPAVERLRAFLAERLPEHMLPAQLVWLEALPLSPNGKVDRRALPAPKGTRPRLEQRYVAPRNPVEEVLALLFGQLLGLDRVGIHDGFFSLGGDSLLAVQLVSRAGRALAVDLPLRALFAAPTVAQLAAAAAPGGTLAAEGAAPPDIVPVSRDQPLPLSFAQSRLWLLQELDPQSAAYNLPAALGVDGALDAAALALALSRLVERHEALRTVFPAPGGQPVQRVLAPRPIRLPRVDLARLPAAARRAAWRGIAFTMASRPFDLARGPLLRVALLALGPAESILLFTLHHIVTDGWSTALLARELEEIYRGAVAGAAVELPALPIQVPDFAVWQRRWLAGEEFARLLDYWRRQLGGYTGVLELPADRPRPSVQSLRGARWPVRVPAGVWSPLAARCRGETITPFMCLLAGFAALLCRLTGRRDLGVGTAVANRTRPELEPLVGCFVNALVLRLDLDGDPRFRELAARARDVVIEAAMHQEMPFERLVEELAPPRDRSRSPLFQVMLTLQAFQRAELAQDGLVFRQLETGNRTAKFDLELLAWEDAGELAGYLEYSTDLFDASSMARLAGHLGTLLAGAAADPDRHLSALPLLTPAERCQLLLEHNDSDRPLPTAAGALLRIVARRTAETPAATAVICGDERQSYAQLEAGAKRMAWRLAALGVAAETLVGCFAERGAGLLTAVLAIWKAGGAYLPLDPQHPARRLGEVIRQSGVEVVVTSHPMRETLEQALASIATPAAAPLPRVALLEELLGPGLPAEDAAVAPPPDTAPGALAYVIFTSGSTGRPKGAMVEHLGMVNHLLAKVGDLGLHAGDVVAQTASQCFDVSVWQLLAPLLAGGQVQIVDDAAVRDPALLAGAVESGGVTVLEVVPSQLRALLADLAGRADRPAFGRLRWLVVTGETLPAALCADWLRLYPAVPLVNAYGPTECSDDVTHQFIVRPPDDGAASVPIGRPLANTRLYVVGRHGSLLPLGAPGELWVAGPAVGRGYRGDADRTAEAFVPDPLAARPGERAYRTGDRARWRADGALDLLGRLDQQVKVRGYRVETGDLEAALGELPQLAAAAAGTRLGPGGEVQLVAWVVPRGGALDIEAARRGLRARLPEYMLPTAWVTMDALPLTANGKLDRRALPAAPRPAAEAAGQAPATAAEAALAAIWAEVLGVEQVGRDDDFFSLGGHSLLAARIAARVRAVLGAELAMRQVFETPVLWQQAAALSDAVAGAGAAPPLATSSRPAHPPLSFAQERLWLIDQAQPGDASYNIPRAVRLRGVLDLPALRRVLSELVRRQQVLRTTFPLAGDLPYQRVAPADPWPLPVADLAPLPEADGDRELARLTRQQIDTPFDLARGPVWRTLLVRRGAADHVLFVTFHHVASDGWSLVVLVREIAALYEAFAAGRSSPLPDLPVQYVDYALWQRQWLRGAALDQLLGFWTSQLRGPLPALRLPFDRPEISPGPPRAGVVRIALPPALSAAVLALCRRERTTPFLVLLAAFAELLRLYAADDEVLIGAPFAGRSRLELEGLLGPFLNTVVLRVDLAGDPEFRELLRRVREVVLGAEAHQHLPFEKLVHALGRHDDPARSGLYQAWFNYQELPPDVSPRGLQVEPLPLEPRHTKFDLALNLALADGEIGGTFEFSRDRFDSATIERLGRYLQWLVAECVGQPCTRLRQILGQLAAKEREDRSSVAQEAKSAFRARLGNPRRRRAGSPVPKGVT